MTLNFWVNIHLCCSKGRPLHWTTLNIIIVLESWFTDIEPPGLLTQFLICVTLVIVKVNGTIQDKTVRELFSLGEEIVALKKSQGPIHLAWCTMTWHARKRVKFPTVFRASWLQDLLPCIGDYDVTRTTLSTDLKQIHLSFGSCFLLLLFD